MRNAESQTGYTVPVCDSAFQQPQFGMARFGVVVQPSGLRELWQARGVHHKLALWNPSRRLRCSSSPSPASKTRRPLPQVWGRGVRGCDFSKLCDVTNGNTSPPYLGERSPSEVRRMADET